MSPLSLLPTRNCVYVGRTNRPLNAPTQLPAAVHSYLTQVAELTEPGLISWHRGTEPVTRDLGTIQGPVTTIFACTDDHGDDTTPGAWADPTRMRQRLRKTFNGAMRGRTLQVVPFEVNDHLGILLTDSSVLVNSVAMIATTGDAPLARIVAGNPWTTIVHCQQAEDEKNYLVRFCDGGETWAFGPGHRGKMLLGVDHEPGPALAAL